MRVRVKRVYEPAAEADGARVLVDRLWPRGLSKESAAITTWLRDLAPSNELRQWYHARPLQWPTFRKRYLSELSNPEAATALQQLYNLVASNKSVTLLFASRNLEHNNAVVLKELIEGRRKPPSSSGPMRAAALAKSARARR